MVDWGEAAEVGGEPKPYIQVGVGERKIRHQPAKQSGACPPRTLAQVGVARNCERRDVRVGRCDLAGDSNAGDKAPRLVAHGPEGDSGGDTQETGPGAQTRGERHMETRTDRQRAKAIAHAEKTVKLYEASRRLQTPAE